MTKHHLPIDEWHTIPGFPRYQINRLGVIVSLRHGTSRRLRPTRTRMGYVISLHHEGHNRVFMLHRLLLQVFRPISDAKSYTVVPKDGNRLNICLENLEWRLHAGSQHPRAKLTEVQVQEIRRRYREDHTLSQASLGKEYGVAWETIRSIVNDRAWTHIGQRAMVK